MAYRVILALLMVLLWPATALAEDCKNSETQTCVDNADLEAFVQLARERQCLDETKPEFKLDPVTIISDTSGRVFYTGADPKHPYQLHMSWCNYKVDAEGEVKVVTALKEPETWGLRFRPKAYLGYLPLKQILADKKFSEAIDAGAMLDVFHYEWVNLNATIGIRSVGAGVGFDITNNFGVYAGWALSWEGLFSVEEPTQNVLGSVYFAF